MLLICRQLKETIKLLMYARFLLIRIGIFIYVFLSVWLPSYVVINYSHGANAWLNVRSAVVDLSFVIAAFSAATVDLESLLSY